MQISVSELKIHAGKYVELSENQDIFITKNGKRVAKITSVKADKKAAMSSIFGAIPPDASLDEAKERRYT